MNKYEMVKKYYEKGLWDINRVYNVVGRAITVDEYKEITGFIYPSKGDGNNETIN